MSGRQARRRRTTKGKTAPDATQAASRPDLSIEAVIAGMDERDRALAALVASSKRPRPPPSPGDRVRAVLIAAMLIGGAALFGGMFLDGLLDGRIDYGLGRHLGGNGIRISASLSHSPVLFAGTMLAGGLVALSALGLAVSALSVAFRGIGGRRPERE